jgi:hypothetical protein
MADGAVGGRDPGGGIAQVGGVTDHAKFVIRLVDTMGSGNEPVAAYAHGGAMAA